MTTYKIKGLFKREGNFKNQDYCNTYLILEIVKQEGVQFQGDIPQVTYKVKKGYDITQFKFGKDINIKLDKFNQIYFIKHV